MAATMNGDESPTGSAIENVGSTPDDIDFEAIMQLMTSKYTVDLVDRHVGAIRKVCKTCRNGFLLAHLESLVELLHLVVQRFAGGNHCFAPAICEFARVASQPFVSCKTSDMINYGFHLPTLIKGLVSTLSYALPPTEDPASIEDPEARAAFEDRIAMNGRVRIEIAHTLACWSRFGLDEDSVELKPNQPLIQAVADAGTPNLRILQQSQVMDELSSSFRVEDSPEAIVITLGAIRDMSLYRPLARQITNCGLISNLVHVIRVNLLGSDVLLVAGEVLWNVLELDWQGAAEALGQEDIVESFRDFMDAVLTKGYRFKDKIFRNDMMVLLMYISKRAENRSFFATTGLMALLLCHAITDGCRKALQSMGGLEDLLRTGPSSGLATVEMFNGNSKQGSLALTNSQEDIEFRILLWGTLARCCSDEKCAEVASEWLFVPSLLSYLDSTQVPGDQRQWSQEQKRKMQLEALSALFLLVQYMPTVFREAAGNSVVLQLLQETNNREVQKKCLHLLQIAVRQGKEFSVELGSLGAVGVLIELFGDKDVPMSGRQLCISVLAGLCGVANADNCREFRKKGGVEAIRDQVIYRPDETTDNHLYCTLCVVDAIWCAIVGTRKNEVRFLDAGGLFALLDVLEIAPLLLKRQIIGCLADLVQYRRAAKLFVQWNSQVTMKGALKILLELWQSEQEAAGSTTGEGVIRDFNRPLNPIDDAGADEQVLERVGSASSDSSNGSSRAGARLQQAKNFANTTGGFSKASQGMRQTKNAKTGGGATGPEDLTPAISDRQDCRAKIFSILSCIGFECHEALNIAERQQMELVKLFPDCVQLETWIKVEENLASKNIKPISADRKWIDDAINERKDLTQWVVGVQTQLADERRSEEQASLHRFYEDIRSRAQFRRTAGGGGQGRPGGPAPVEEEDDFPDSGWAG